MILAFQVSFAFCKEFYKSLQQSLEEGRFGHTDTVATVFSKVSLAIISSCIARPQKMMISVFKDGFANRYVSSILHKL